jgi:hypothetical protein
MRANLIQKFVLHICVVFLLREFEYGSENMTSIYILYLEFHISSAYFPCGCDNGSSNTFLIGNFCYMHHTYKASFLTMFLDTFLAHIHLLQTVMEDGNRINMLILMIQWIQDIKVCRIDCNTNIWEDNVGKNGMEVCAGFNWFRTGSCGKLK